MKAVIARVTRASVRVDDRVVGSIGPGLLALVGVSRTDGPDDVALMARKISGLRLFESTTPDSPAEVSALECAAPILLVSQFTLMGDTSHGRRPSWSAAAPGPVAEPLITELADALRAQGLEVQTGSFGAYMQVESVNDGPFTVIVDTAKQ